MHVVVVIVHVITCLLLIAVVLLQQGKGADMGAVFGGSSATIFGSSGAGNFLTRLTTGLAVVFMLTSLTLTYASGRSVTTSVFDSAPLGEPPPLAAPAGEEGGVAPAAPEPGAAAPEPGAPAPNVAVTVEQPVQVAPAPAGAEGAEAAAGEGGRGAAGTEAR